jgi:hypothetical protein
VSTVKQELDRNKNGAARRQIVDSAKEADQGIRKQKSQAVIESASRKRGRGPVVAACRRALRAATIRRETAPFITAKPA